MLDHASHSKVENVEKPPIKPTGTRYLQAGLKPMWRFRYSTTSPIRKQAPTLIVNVPR
jgi:hypothetical protein